MDSCRNDFNTKNCLSSQCGACERKANQYFYGDCIKCDYSQYIDYLCIECVHYMFSKLNEQRVENNEQNLYCRFCKEYNMTGFKKYEQ